MEKELKIVAPEGYEIDREKSTLGRIVFKKKEAKLPESWEEFCDITPRIGSFMDMGSTIMEAHDPDATMFYNSVRNLLSTQEDCEAHRALMQLHRLRDCYRKGWKPSLDNIGYAVTVTHGGRIQVSTVPRFLSFQDRWVAIKFAEHFRELILTAKELLR